MSHELSKRCRVLAHVAYRDGASQIIKHDERLTIALVLQFAPENRADYERFAHAANEALRKIAYGMAYQPQAFGAADTR